MSSTFLPRKRSRISRCILLAVLVALVVKFCQDAHHTAFVGGVATGGGWIFSEFGVPRFGGEIFCGGKNGDAIKHEISSR